MCSACAVSDSWQTPEVRVPRASGKEKLGVQGLRPSLLCSCQVFGVHIVRDLTVDAPGLLTVEKGNPKWFLRKS